MNAKKIGAILLCFTIFVCVYCQPVYALNITDNIVIDNIEILDNGNGSIIAHYKDAPVGTQISCIIGSEKLLSEDGTIQNMNMDNLIHIDQVETGNNGTFLINFSISSKWSGKKMMIIFGTSFGDNLVTTYEIPGIPTGLDVVAYNSVLYGRDIYFVTGYYYTPENIAKSLIEGGNNIYFYLGGQWYNLMSEDAKDNSFLVEENASPKSDVEDIKPIYYYSLTDKIKLKWLGRRVQFMDSDINVDISGYVPKINGTLEVKEGKTLTLSIVNTTDNSNIVSEIITADDGVFNLNCSLPSLLRKKSYKISVSCANNEGKELLNMDLNIGAQILLLNVSGTATTSDNIDIDTHIESTNLGLINNDTTISGSHSISTVIPNIVASASLNLKAIAYEIEEDDI